MQIETFEIEEMTSSGAAPEEIEAEATALVEKCGLKGQLTLLVKSEAAPEGVRIPYPEMTQAERRVYETHFPKQTKVEDYKAGIIPLRVLQVISHCQETEMFEAGLWIWHPGTLLPDPILVGRKGKDYSWTHYLLARWGAALKPFAELAEEALPMTVRSFTAELQKKIGDCQGKLAAVGALAQQHLAGEWVAI